MTWGTRSDTLLCSTRRQRCHCRPWRWAGVRRMDIKRDTSYMYKGARSTGITPEELLWLCGGISHLLGWSGDKERLYRLVRKASYVLGCSLDSAEEETAELSSMLETLSHPLQGILATLGCPTLLLPAYCGQILQEAHLVGWSLPAPSLLLTIADAIVLCTTVYLFWLFFVCLSSSCCLPLNWIHLLL